MSLKESDELNTIDKLIKKINEINIPIYTDNYFVKKAEIELDKIEEYPLLPKAIKDVLKENKFPIHKINNDLK